MTRRPERFWPAIRSAFIAVILLSAIPAGGASAVVAADNPSLCDRDVVQPSGAVTRVCMPATMPWNGDLIVWAHGYVEAGQPVAIPEDQLCLGGGTFCISTIANALGYGFITTSYRMNGMVTTGVEDVAELVDIFSQTRGRPNHVFLVGASEGGLITTLAVESKPEIFSGGLAACGPIGDFRRQINYYGDFRVLFDYFFPGLLPGTPVKIPADLIDNWDAVWSDSIRPVVFDSANAATLKELLRTARATWDRNDPASIEKTVHDALWYNVFATNDLTDKVGGQPFDNTKKLYWGSSDDVALNALVARYAADPVALQTVDALFQTTGLLQNPLVTLHTWMDQQVSVSQEFLYRRKLRATRSLSKEVFIPAFRYGHCNFKPWEAVLSFAILVYRVDGSVPAGAADLLPTRAERSAYRKAARQAGIPTD